MWERGWRDQMWSQLDAPRDLIIIGGGITGAGILREAARAGLSALLVEAQDFASGTSSRSSKLVHGGLRYLQNAQIKLTLESVRERERLTREGRGLVEPLGFLLAHFEGDRPPAWVSGMGLILYDLLALKWDHRRYDPAGLRALCPMLTATELEGGYRYFDAQTDDARLVLRVLREAVRGGGAAFNYARVEGLLRTRTGQACGVILRDQAEGPGGRTAEVRAPVVINATGAWADELRRQVGGQPRLRKLRGSHLIFPREKLPLQWAVSFLHPQDRRPVFVLPWEGVSVIGTTDVDHRSDMEVEPAISEAEAEYLLATLTRAFPGAGLRPADVRAAFAGVRAVVNTGKANPSEESREFALWQENGLVTITGGKLTTFRLMAHRALRTVRARLPARPTFDANRRVLDTPPDERCLNASLDPATCLRLTGRYGIDALALLAAAHPGELEPIADTPTLWAEVRWAARAEGVVHLDDLLLRRLRLGLTLPRGGLPWMERIRAVAQPELGWDDARWEAEVAAYTRRWGTHYRLP